MQALDRGAVVRWPAVVRRRVGIPCALLALAPAASATPGEAPRSVRVVATIDGLEELHLGPRRASWVHIQYSAPERVEIDGCEWNPARDERLDAPVGQPFFDPELDLAGASARLVRGRGEIAFRHEGQELVVRFDDSRGGGAGEYEVEIEFADALCAAHARCGDAPYETMTWPRELRIEAHVDGVDELQLGPERADWLHLSWSWPSEVRLGDRAWESLVEPLRPAPGALFFLPGLELADVSLEVERGRGQVSLTRSGGRLFVRFDDGGPLGADDYAVRLHFPPRPADWKPELPTGPALRVELRHTPAADVAGANLVVLATSPRRGELVPWPGMRGFDASGRCVLALPVGTYRFEVLNRPEADRLVALRSEPVSVDRARALELPATARRLEWRQGKERLEPREFAVHSLLPEGEVVWTRSDGGGAPVLVVSPEEEFSLRAFGTHDDTWVAWWTRRRLGERGPLDSSNQNWVRCAFEGADEGALPPACTVRLHAPTSALEFPVSARTELLTNRRFISLSYRHALADGGEAVFHPRPLLLSPLGTAQRLELGGALSARASVAILQDERLGSPEARRLWWKLDMVDAAGSVLDTETSRIEWRARALARSGARLPEPPLSEDALAALADPVATVVLEASFRWNGPQTLHVEPRAPVVLENERYRSRVPGDLGWRARAYLDKAKRTYHAIETARGEAGTHDGPIELKWWLNGGAVGAWGSITMPIDGMTADYDWFSLPWALAHESLHAFGYAHGEELERIDSEVIHAFAVARQTAERDPDFVPDGW